MKRNYLVPLVLVLCVTFGCAQPPVETPSSTPALEEEDVNSTPTQPITDYDGPIIDAHSQFCPDNIEKVMPLMDQGGVACTILSPGVTSTKGIVTPEELVSFASNYPGRIIPAVRTKVRGYENYYELLEKQMNIEGYGAMAEVLMYHSQKGNRAPEIVAYPDDEKVQVALNYALDKEWPFVIHIEFASASCPSDEFMTGLKALLVEYPEHPFVLIHMGQLGHAAVRQLIEAHDNIYFITSSSTPIYATNPFNDRWTNMFDDDHFSAEWQQLIIDHPHRFVLGFDMVWVEQWGEFYLGQVTLWRRAIGKLPLEVAHALAHGNAEHLWHLPPSPSIIPELPVGVPAPLLDTTPPPLVTGLAIADAYDGKVNLRWDESTAEDFDYYSVYAGKSEIADVTGMTPIHEIRDIATNAYQVTGLEDGTKHYFTVTAVDKSGNENPSAACLSITPTPMPRGTVDPDLHVDVYHSDMTWAGTTLLADNHNLESPRAIEVNMLGEIIWEYQVPQNLKQYINPGFDTEWLPNNNILLVLPGNGVYEIERDGNIVWSYLDTKVSHDADRLANGNTLVVYGGEDKTDDAQVKEINPDGEIVWAWYAKDYFYKSPYKDIYDQGWTHTNAASRLPNGNTIISLRNFHFVVEVDPQGEVVKTIGEGIFHNQHDPEILPSSNILSATHTSDQAVEIDLKTGEVVWRLAQEWGMWRVRDADRLPNGNTLITDATKIAEVTPGREIVWLLKLEGVTYQPQDWPRRGFYKAERISPVPLG